MMEGGRYSFASSPVSQERPRLPDNVKKIDLTPLPVLAGLDFSAQPVHMQQLAIRDAQESNGDLTPSHK